ncbi:hypothetical protein PT276_05640 [Orbaceae bacterium ESL0721]|nr:hypothetical protein [Orbaceae bacterium ESL0721]
MKILDKQNDLIQIEMDKREFNLIRDLESAVLLSCSTNEIPTLTGWTKEELIKFGNMLSELANNYNIEL